MGDWEAGGLLNKRAGLMIGDAEGGVMGNLSGVRFSVALPVRIVPGGNWNMEEVEVEDKA